MDDLKYLAEHPFEYLDGHMEVCMGVCLTCSAMQSPHVLAECQVTGSTEPPARLEYDTVDHALVGLLRFAAVLAEREHPGVWDFIYSLAAWRMQLPGVQTLPPPVPRAN